MKDKKSLLILAVVGIAVLIGILFFLLSGEDSPGEGPDDDSKSEVVGNELGPWGDAPAPWIDEEELDHFRNLWPDAFDQQKVDKEQVRKEWAEFAERYPDNVYVPSLFKPEMSEEEKEQARVTLDRITDIDAKLASARARARKAGNNPPNEEQDPGQGDISPEDQRFYFQEKLKELNSRKQLIEYVKEQGELDADQTATAAEDLKQIEEEIKNVTEMLQSIPG